MNNYNKAIIENQEKIFNLLNKLDASTVKLDTIEYIYRTMSRIEEYILSGYIENNIPKIGEIFADGESVKEVLTDIYNDIDSIYIGIDISMSEMDKKIKEITEDIARLNKLKSVVENLEKKVNAGQAASR